MVFIISLMFVYGYSILSARLVVAFVSGTQRTRLIIWVSKKLLLIYPTVLNSCFQPGSLRKSGQAMRQGRQLELGYETTLVFSLRSWYMLMIGYIEQACFHLSDLWVCNRARYKGGICNHSRQVACSVCYARIDTFSISIKKIITITRNLI